VLRATEIAPVIHYLGKALTKAFYSKLCHYYDFLSAGLTVRPRAQRLRRRSWGDFRSKFMSAYCALGVSGFMRCLLWNAGRREEGDWIVPPRSQAPGRRSEKGDRRAQRGPRDLHRDSQEQHAQFKAERAHFRQCAAGEVAVRGELPHEGPKWPPALSWEETTEALCFARGCSAHFFLQ